MRNDVIQTIKDTLEDSQDIKVLSLNVVDNILFGVYINDVKDNLSFLTLPKKHFQTTIDDVNIQFFELGTVLHHIYFTGALKFLDILYPDDKIITPDPHYINLCEFILENIPFNIAKLKYIQACDEYLDNGTGVEHVSILMNLTLELNLNLLTWGDGNMDNFLYVKDIETESDCIKACNSINAFKQWLKEQKFSKISEKNINRINDMYVNIQILNMKV